MPTAPRPRGPKAWRVAALAVITVVSVLAGPGAAASAPDPVPAPEGAAGAAADRQGEASSFVSARDTYERAQSLYRSAEHASALVEIDDAIRSLNYVMTHSEDASVRRAAGDLLRRVGSLRLACTRAMESERLQLRLVGPPAPSMQVGPGRRSATVQPQAESDPQAPEAADQPSRPSSAAGSPASLDAMGLAVPTGSGAPLGEPDLTAGADGGAGPAGAVGGATEPSTSPPGIELEDNSQVQKWVDFYTGRGRATFEKWLRRSGFYMDWMKDILQSEGLPTDLVHLVFVESGFNPDARSRSHAVGPWQFIRGTAKLFGLKVDRWIDERKDPERATLAAARYLKHLYALFESWPLALASYNAGEGTVMKAISRQGTKDFWQLKLPRQTRDYVPQFLACLRIAHEPERYGFDAVEREAPLEFDTVQIPGPADLRAVAAACGSSVETLRLLNPALLRHAAPTDPVGLVTLRVPAGTGQGLLDGLSSGSISLPQVSTPPDPPYVRHKVRRGETLATISRRYGITASELAAANGISTKARVRRGRVLRVPTDSASNVAFYSSSPPAATLGGVAGADTARAPAAAKAAAASGTEGRGDKSGAEERAAAPSGKDRVAVYGGTRVHRVQPGETLSEIAERYGTNVRTLRALNGLRPKQQIKAGARLKVPVDQQG